MTDAPSGPGRLGRGLVLGVLVLLLAAGVVGIESWPLTEWKLFSASRDETQTTYVLAAAIEGRDDGRMTPFDLEDLPLGYRTAEWPMSRLTRLPDDERDEICVALLDGVIDAVGTPDVAVELWRDRQTKVEEDGDWVITHDVEVLQRCAREPDR